MEKQAKKNKNQKEKLSTREIEGLMGMQQLLICNKVKSGWSYFHPVLTNF
ncbi:hypothetical protein [Bacillus toyonensis]|nr:hypothetical protein [Bacillus toyonensis]